MPSISIISAFLVLLLASCGKEQIETYQVPKEKPAAPMAQAQPQAPAQQPAAAEPSTSGLGFTVDLPAGWKEVPSSSAMRKVSYAIEGTNIDFYLISLSMGDVPSNVNRWRGQIGLADASAADIEKEMATFVADHHEVKLFELYNPETEKGIIAAILDLSPQYWYFTAKGSVDELQAHAADIRKYLESIKFEGHNH